MRDPFSGLAALHGFSQDLSYHRLLPLKLTDLLVCSGQLRGRNYLFSGGNRRQTALQALFLPLKALLI